MIEMLKKCTALGLVLAMGIFITYVLTGCTMYTVEKTNDSTIVKVKSTRSFEQPDLHYIRDGEAAEFDFKAASATDGSVEVMGQMMQMMQMMMGAYMGMPPVPPPTTDGN